MDPDRARDERVARMSAGLLELDRWLDDRARTGLADPALARYATWDALAARLVDAQVGALANRVRRLAGVVGVGPRWHEDVLAELGILHLLAHAGRHLGDLPPVLADAVAMALGWQVRQAEVLAGAPLTDRWAVMGRSDVREDRIEVRRVWLRGTETGRWAMVLSFAAYRQSLDESFEVGTEVPADLFFYPGAGLRALVGRRHGPAVAGISDVHGLTRRSVAATATTVGAAIALEPWLEHYPVVMMATPTRVRGARRWVLADSTGSLPIAGWFADGGSALATLLACSAGVAVLLTCEWTPAGLVPLTVHLSDRSVDIGPVADESFVASA